MPVRRTERRMKRMGNLPGPAQQLDLFGDDRPRTIVDTPAWPATVSRPVQKDDMPAASTRVARPIERGTVTSPLQRERQSASRPCGPVRRANHGSAPVLRPRSLGGLPSRVQRQQILLVARDQFRIAVASADLIVAHRSPIAGGGKLVQLV